MSDFEAEEGQRQRGLVEGRSVTHRWIRDRITTARWFEMFLVGVIVLNSVILWPMTDALRHQDPLPPAHPYSILNYIFVFIYFLEFSLRLYVEPLGYWHSRWNVFDFCILASSIALIIVELIFKSTITILRVIRTLRVFCIFRVFRYVQGLQVLMMAFFKTITDWLASILLLMIIVLYVFAVTSDYYFGTEEMWWGTMGRCLISLLSLFTSDGWTGIEETLEEAGFKTAAKVFCTIAICIGNFIFTQTVVAIILLNINSATQKFKQVEREQKERVLRHKKEYMMIRQRNDLMEMMKHQQKGKYANFTELVQEYRSQLNHRDIMIASDLSANLLWLETFIQTLDHMDGPLHNIQQLHYEMVGNVMQASDLRLRKIYLHGLEDE